MFRPTAAVLALLCAAPAARADGVGGAAPGATDYFAAPASNTITVRTQRTRTLEQRLLIAGLAGGAVIAGGVGVWFHLDSRDAAAEVSEDDGPSGETWTVDHQAAYDRAGSSGVKAVIGYAASAVLLGATIAVVARTRPGDDEAVVRPGARAGTPVIAPVRGGAVVGGEWRW